jgi:hypothetical protein
MRMPRASFGKGFVPTPFAYKLRFTAAALGCASRKDLCQRFRAANPATVVDLDRCHKWLQGAALPRSTSVYDDWAKLLGPAWSAAWIAASSPEAFAEVLCERLCADRASLEAQAARFGRGRVAEAPPAPRAPDPRAGAFVAYSWAMSPRFEGRLIRGCLTLAGGRRGRLAATYEEGFAAGPLRFSGSATESGRTLHLDFDHADDPGLGRFFMVLLTEGRPFDVLCGEFLGAPVHDSSPRPSASRIALLRIGADAGCGTARAAAAPECYVAAEALSADLARLGVAAPGAVAEALLDVLSRPRPPLARTDVADLARLASARAA